MKKYIHNNLWQCIGMIIGVIAIIVGIVFIYNSRYTYYLDTVKFGGDFYTEIYGATKFVSSVSKEIYSVLSKGLGVLFILIGAIDICVFGSRLTPVREETEVETVLEPAVETIIPEEIDVT